MHCSHAKSNLFAAHASAELPCGWIARATVAQGCPAYQEDRVVMRSLGGGGGCALLAVFDGHGGSAAATLASQLCTAIIQGHKDVRRAARSKLGHKIWEDVMNYAFQFLDNVIISSAPFERGTWSGAAACIVVITPFEIVSANAGDSRSVLMCVTRGTLRLSRDHTPHEDKEETERVRQRGACVDRDGYVRFRSGVSPGMAGLAMTRSLGDKEGKRGSTPAAHVIIAKPHVRVVSVEAATRGVILASDGMWDVIQDRDASTAAMQAIAAGFDPSCHLIMGSLGLWADRRVSRDNMCAVVAWRPALFKPSTVAGASVLACYSPHDAKIIQHVRASTGNDTCLQTALAITALHLAKKNNTAPPVDATTNAHLAFPCLSVGIAPSGFVWARTDKSHDMLRKYANAAKKRQLPCIEPLCIGEKTNPHVAKAISLLPNEEKPKKDAHDVRWTDLAYHTRQINK
jgi:serine/threonine protein phosphatase PrpC